MESNALLLPMTAHVVWMVVLYAALTMVRAPTVWGVAAGSAWAARFRRIEPRVSANLSNQFEWPLIFYAACILLLTIGEADDAVALALAWLFVVGRLVHSGVQVLTTNVRLRGVVFTINFLAVLGLWGRVLVHAFEVGA